MSNFAITATNVENSEGVIAGARSGLMTGIAADANVFALVNLEDRPIAVTGMSLAWLTTTAFTTAQSMAIQVAKVRSFTAAPTGVAVGVTLKYREALVGAATPHKVPQTKVACAVSDTAALSGGTFEAPDADEPLWLLVTASATKPAGSMVWAPADGLPIVLPRNTGLLGRVSLAMGAAGVGRLFVQVEGYRAAP